MGSFDCGCCLTSHAVQSIYGISTDIEDFENASSEKMVIATSIVVLASWKWKTNRSKRTVLGGDFPCEDMIELEETL
ncbi:unnamed protein product [Sphenostylis stenocarpa]|uniref:Uncharacterized protein n=1 Tax=Sphenostylis stenocarpa TaxID=92480 RepID=A0AA86VLM9_9FABA|nr:unnamed protein product [Sphenostylis stenocarpa]